MIGMKMREEQCIDLCERYFDLLNALSSPAANSRTATSVSRPALEYLDQNDPGFPKRSVMEQRESCEQLQSVNCTDNDALCVRSDECDGERAGFQNSATS